MAAIFIIGEEGSSDLWLVDTGSGTVKSIASEGGGVEPELIKTIQAMRANGFRIAKKVDVAIAAPAASELTSREFTQNG